MWTSRTRVFQIWTRRERDFQAPDCGSFFHKREYSDLDRKRNSKVNQSRR